MEDADLQAELFSKRFGYPKYDAPIRVREDAPPSFRYWLPRLALQQSMPPSTMRELLCEVLRTPPDRAASDDKVIFQEVETLLEQCAWYRVYDVVERFAYWFAEEGPLERFSEPLNEYLREEGIGWELDVCDGLVTRGEGEFQTELRRTFEDLAEAEYSTAKTELHEAIRDLSRRPEPDLTGAIQHAAAAMECVAREYCGEPKPTFGDLLKHHPDMLPRPLDMGVEKAWGYASDRARHVREGQQLEREEAELIVGIAQSVSMYVIQKRKREQQLSQHQEPPLGPRASV